MTQSSDETLTGPVRGRYGRHRQAPQAGRPGAALEHRPQSRGRRSCSSLRCCCPGTCISASASPAARAALFGVLGVVTLLSLASLAMTGRLRLALNLPYLLLVLAFILFDVFETIRSGSGVAVPGGVGPGGWLGVAGALLAAQPAITGADGVQRVAEVRPDHRLRVDSRRVAVHRLPPVVAGALRVAGPSSGFGKQNIAVIATAVVYGAVALAAVLIASRWLLRSTKASGSRPSRLGPRRWWPGSWCGAFPSAATSTHSTPSRRTRRRPASDSRVIWPGPRARRSCAATLLGYRHRPRRRKPMAGGCPNGLLLIALWCVGSVLMRTNDLAVAVRLDYPFSRYDTLALAAFDLATGVLAIWLRVNLANASVRARLTSFACGLLSRSAFSCCGGLRAGPPIRGTPNGGGWDNPVYGNDLAQQITSTFDVVLCGLALGILAFAIITGRLAGLRLRRQKRRVGPPAGRGVAHPGPPSRRRLRRPPASLPAPRLESSAGTIPPRGRHLARSPDSIDRRRTLRSIPRQRLSRQLQRQSDAVVRHAVVRCVDATPATPPPQILERFMFFSDFANTSTALTPSPGVMPHPGRSLKRLPHNIFRATGRGLPPDSRSC